MVIVWKYLISITFPNNEQQGTKQGKERNNMKYDVVELKEKTVVGVMAKTNNSAPDMEQVIGGLWQQFYSGIHTEISNKVNEKALGIYTDYENEEKADYHVIVGYEVEKAEKVPEGTITRVLPAGKYAKFIVRGHMQKAVAEFWEKLWQMDLPRTFTYDFEEYQNGNMEDAEIHIYISIK